ncbi:ABC transporter ATP-binding protein [Blautia schinkii]|nr:ABC transporter ATP-binding protein [Blautia schinkii]
MLLAVENLSVNYGAIKALRDVSFAIDEGEIVAVVGHNGAGKSTLLRTISGLLKPVHGAILWKDTNIAGKSAEQVVRLGISQAPEGRQIFAESSVYENIEIGAYVRHDNEEIQKDIQRYLERFPILKERKNQKAGLMSGGEQQMLAIVRALMSRPKLLLLDEPSLGLSPVIIKEVYKTISEIRKAGTTVLLVEQNAKKALDVSDRAYVLANGEIVLSGLSAELAQNQEVKKAYLGG